MDQDSELWANMPSPPTSPITITAKCEEVPYEATFVDGDKKDPLDAKPADITLQFEPELQLETQVLASDLLLDQCTPQQLQEMLLPQTEQLKDIEEPTQHELQAGSNYVEAERVAVEQVEEKQIAQQQAEQKEIAEEQAEQEQIAEEQTDQEQAEEQVEEQVEEHVEEKVEEQVEEQVEEKVVEEQLEEHVKEHVEEQVEEKVEEKVEQFEKQVEEQVVEQVEKQVEEQVEEQVEQRVEDQVEERAVEEQVVEEKAAEEQVAEETVGEQDVEEQTVDEQSAEDEVEKADVQSVEEEPIEVQLIQDQIKRSHDVEEQMDIEEIVEEVIEQEIAAVEQDKQEPSEGKADEQGEDDAQLETQPEPYDNPDDAEPAFEILRDDVEEQQEQEESGEYWIEKCQQVLEDIKLQHAEQCAAMEANTEMTEAYDDLTPAQKAYSGISPTSSSTGDKQLRLPRAIVRRVADLTTDVRTSVINMEKMFADKFRMLEDLLPEPIAPDAEIPELVETVYGKIMEMEREMIDILKIYQEVLNDEHAKNCRVVEELDELRDEADIQNHQMRSQIAELLWENTRLKSEKTELIMDIATMRDTLGVAIERQSSHGSVNQTDAQTQANHAED